MGEELSGINEKKRTRAREFGDSDKESAAEQRPSEPSAANEEMFLCSLDVISVIR